MTKYGHLFDWMSHVVCSDDPEVKRGKPAPDIYQLAAARFDTPPQSSSNVSDGWREGVDGLRGVLFFYCLYVQEQLI